MASAAAVAQKDSASTEGGAGGRAQTKTDLATKLAGRIVDVRARRRPIDEEDLRSHAMQHGIRGRFFYNSDTFKHYIPLGRRAIERFVVRVIQSLIPNDQFMECYPGDDMSEPNGAEAQANGAVMMYLLRKRIGIRKLASQLARTLLLYRRAIVKTSVKVTDAPIKMGAIRGRLKEVWPDAVAVDPFSFYVYPETSPNLSDKGLIFEDMNMPWSDYLGHVKAGRCDSLQQSELVKPEFPYHLVTRLAVTGFSTPDAVTATATYEQNVAGRAGSENAQPLQTEVSLSDCWFYSNDKLMNAWLVWNVNDPPKCVRFKVSEYPAPPYRWAVARPLPGETYSTTLANDVEPLQILLNDQFNQMEEARSVAALPPVALDPNLIARTDSIVYGARKRWLVENPKEAIQALQIPDTSKTSLAASQNTMGLINTIGGASPLAEGQPTRGLPRAGMAVQNLISLGLADITDTATIIETELLEPMMEDLHRLLVAFTPKSQVLQIPGTAAYAAQAVTVDTLAGNWSFNWVGAQQLQAMSSKATMLMQFWQGLIKASPVLEQQGWAARLGPLTKRVWRDALGERGVEDIVVPLSELMKDKHMQEARAMQLQMAQERAAMVVPPKKTVTLRGEIMPDVATELAIGHSGQPAPASSQGGGGAPGAPAGSGVPSAAGTVAPLPGGSEGNMPGGGPNG